MSRRPSLLRLLTERGPLLATVTACVLMVVLSGSASAQFFDFGFGRRPVQQAPRGGGFFSPFGDVFGPGPRPPASEPQQAPRPAVDYSHAPPPAKREAPAERNVLVLGDAMADWLAYGLEDALSETPELGVIRKHKTVSGLIRYQPKGDPADWVAAAKEIVATEKADVIVVMLGLSDRVSIREPVAEKKADGKADNKKTAKKDSKQDSHAKPGDAASGPDDKSADNKPAEAAPGDDEDDQPQVATQEKPRSANGVYEFRDERWVELYSKKIEDMIAVLKSKGVPVLWVGLPAVRGPKATSDMLFLDGLYRDQAGKAGITYVDVWDGFVDDAGRFAQQGPDFEGQIRRLRTSDGVFFTKAGARKLAHYTEREIRRVLAARSGPIALPSESFAPDTNVKPDSPRPLMGPVVPLVASSIGTDELLGGVGTRPASVDALAARTMVKGEALAPPAGRADDASWPRREVGALDAPAGDPGAAAATATSPGTSPSASEATTPGAPKSAAKKPSAPSHPQESAPVVQRTPRQDQEGLFGFFPSFGTQAPPPQQQAPRPRGAPRPSGNVGPAASTPGGFFSFIR